MHNSRQLRILVRAPVYLALLNLILSPLPKYLEPRDSLTEGGHLRALGGHPALAHVVSYAADASLILCGLTATVVLVEVVRHARLPLGTLRVGLWFSYAFTALLWVSAIAAIALSAHFGVGAAKIGSGWFSDFPSGGLLALFAAVLGVCAVVSTFGSVMAERSLRVTRALAA